jgi:hypothetical protein
MKYKIGDICFLKTDVEQRLRIITGILIRQNCNLYYLSYCTEESLHYEFEFTEQMNELSKLFN